MEFDTRALCAISEASLNHREARPVVQPTSRRSAYGSRDDVIFVYEGYATGVKQPAKRLAEAFLAIPAGEIALCDEQLTTCHTVV